METQEFVAELEKRYFPLNAGNLERRLFNDLAEAEMKLMRQETIIDRLKQTVADLEHQLSLLQ